MSKGRREVEAIGMEGGRRAGGEEGERGGLEDGDEKVSGN